MTTRPTTFWRSYGKETLALVIALAWCVPYYYLAIVSLKPNAEVFSDPMGFPSRLAFENYPEAWSGSMGISLGRAAFNSAVITVGAVLLAILIGALSAFVVARTRSRMGGVMYVFFLLGLILPYQLSVVPLFSFMRGLGLTGNLGGMVILYAGLMVPLSVFLYTGFIRVLPVDYEEAAAVDGASRARTFLQVVFPLLAPVTGTVAIMTGLIVWNDFFVQLIFLSGSPHQTLPVVVYGFVGEFSARWNMVFAAVFVSILPILAFYLVAQKKLIQGFTGGIKS
ncbi:MAG: carbohydrate ABC transporter permease [Rhodobacteraceae bacterium]|jgi:raffinose/stachyose/melibiose transport system permease protein|nr:carbohydrate ABC transporter permease [Paracoccaceae bacterium]